MEYVRNVVSKAGVKQGSSSIPVVIDARHIQGADFTAAKVSVAQKDNKLESSIHTNPACRYRSLLNQSLTHHLLVVPNFYLETFIFRYCFPLLSLQYNFKILCLSLIV